MGQTVGTWARMYIDDIVRATHPHIVIDAEDVLKQYENGYGAEVLNVECSKLNQDELSRIGYRLHRLTVGALHSRHATERGGPHPGLKNVRV